MSRSRIQPGDMLYWPGSALSALRQTTITSEKKLRPSHWYIELVLSARLVTLHIGRTISRELTVLRIDKRNTAAPVIYRRWYKVEPDNAVIADGDEMLMPTIVKSPPHGEGEQ